MLELMLILEHLSSLSGQLAVRYLLGLPRVEQESLQAFQPPF